MAELLLPKQVVRVRFPSLAPLLNRNPGLLVTAQAGGDEMDVAKSTSADAV